MSLTKLDYTGSDDVQEIEYQTLSSDFSQDQIDRPERLHEWLKSEEIEALYSVFSVKETLNYPELREELENLNIKFTDLEYNRLFLKINQNRDFECDWNEFISYLIFGFQEDDPSSQKEALILPISTPPLIKKSEHRSAVCAIALLKAASDMDEFHEDEKRKEEELDEEELQNKKILSNVAFEESPDMAGVWITASREGQIRFWTMSLESVRTSTSESIHLKMPTWILCIVALSDVNIVCTSSTERELRFHEMVASTFSLRIVIRSLPCAVCDMSYSFHPSGKSNSKLVLGDYGGNVRVLEFDPHLRGPFQSKPGAALIELFWTDVLKGKLVQLKSREYINIHTEMIQCAFFSIALNSLFAAAEYRNTKKYRSRCAGLIVVYGDEKSSFRIPLGVTTFAVDERNNIVVTGGPDMFVRIWDVYIPSEPSGVLTGHNSGIVKVFTQSEDQKAYSIDYQKVIKVWDTSEHSLLQTFGDLIRIFHGETDLVYHYHKQLRVLLVGGRKLVAIKCNPRVRVDLTDGNTHASPVSVVLYNRLFRNVVTCGLDSFIIVWDPWSGRRKIIMKNCHTKQVYGENIDIEITAACFDPLEQFLLTGARDGSLKIWNYNNAVCIRNMSIKSEHEVTAVIWVVERILAVGWDQQVTEFNDVEGREYTDPKIWPTFHTDDITCADVKLGEGVVTATYSGELIFWKLETGQPYRRYNVENPTEFIELKHTTNVRGVSPRGSKDPSFDYHISVSHDLRKSVMNSIKEMEQEFGIKSYRYTGHKLSEADQKEDDYLRERKIVAPTLPMSVQAVLFLQTRPMTKQHGSVLVSLETGIIQVYSHHQRGGYLTEFNAIHKVGDCVLTMCTDRKNRYLFTGTACGYIKIWHIQNFCIPESEKVKICMPLLRLQFIFLRKERFLPRAKRAVRNQKEPLLISSYKGHLKAVNSVVFINLPKILITGSHDCSVRLWSLGGRYLGTLGTPLPWRKMSPFEPITDEARGLRFPPDIKKVASSTTMKVISGVQPKIVKMRQSQQSEREVAEEEEGMRYYGKPLREPILGKHFQLPGRGALEQTIELDVASSYTPVYSHLKVHDADNLERPPTPPVIRRVAKESYMDFYEPIPVRSEGVKTGSLNEYETIRDFTEDLEYKTLSSDFSPDIVERPERLHEWLKSEEIESLHYKFLEKGKLSYPELREELENLNIKFTHLEYNRLFLKISENRISKCDWDEFISYLLNGFREDHPMSTRDDEITLPIHEPPVIRTSEHRSPVCCIALLRTRKLESTEEYSDSDSECEERKFQKFFKEYAVGDSADWAGIWITASREGQLRFWSMGLKPLRAGKSNSVHKKIRTWILCIRALSDVKVVCTSSTERELRFHETVTPSFNLRAVILSMPYAVYNMQYSYYEAQTSRLIMGDYGGSVRILEFDARSKSPFQSKSGRDILEMFWSDIAKGKFPQFRCHEYLNVHTEMIQHVYFARRLNCTFAAAEYRNIKKYRGRCPGLVILSGDDRSTFRVPLVRIFQ
uniref:WD repeat-containing protein on Y chromosome n=1 Tax=Glossina morsitans morsitans TaxID=37546 RepID=A0A1B0FDX8_GLOMM